MAMILNARPFVRHYPKKLVTFGQMVLLVVFINAILKLGSNLMRNARNIPFCPTLLEKFEFLRTNGSSPCDSAIP